MQDSHSEFPRYTNNLVFHQSNHIFHEYFGLALCVKVFTGGSIISQVLFLFDFSVRVIDVLDPDILSKLSALSSLMPPIAQKGTVSTSLLNSDFDRGCFPRSCLVHTSMLPL